MADANTTPVADKDFIGNGRVVTGVVTRDKTLKTRRVEIERLVRHPKYGKFVKRRTVCYAHDEKNEYKVGDKVVIVESRPLSRDKRWRVERLIERPQEA